MNKSDGEETLPDSKSFLFVEKNFISYMSYGVAFILLSLYWLRVIIRCYCKAEVTYDRFVSTIWFPSYKKCRVLTDYNSFFIVFSAVFTAISIMCLDGRKPIPLADNLSLLLTSLFFIIHCLVVNLQQKNIWLPPHVDYISLLITYLVHSVLITNRALTGSENSLDVQLHLLLNALIVMAIVVLFLELAYPNNLTIPIMRCYLAFIQGTWIVHIGFVRYCPLKVLHEQWDIESDTFKMITVASFAGHCLLGFIVMIVLCNCCHGCMSRRANHGPQKKSREAEAEKLIPSDRNISFQ